MRGCSIPFEGSTLSANAVWPGTISPARACARYSSLSLTRQKISLPAVCIFSVTLANNLLVDWNLSRAQKDISGELIN